LISGFTNRILYVFLISLRGATYSAHIIFLDVTQIC
jgi:hypothetical protein